MVFQSGSVEFLPYRCEKAFDVCVAALFGGIEVFLDHVIGVMFKVFEGKVLKLGLHAVESEFVCQRCIDVCGKDGEVLLFGHGGSVLHAS